MVDLLYEAIIEALHGCMESYIYMYMYMTCCVVYVNVHVYCIILYIHDLSVCICLSIVTFDVFFKILQLAHTYENVHQRAVNKLSFHPREVHILLSGSQDSTMCCFVSCTYCVFIFVCMCVHVHVYTCTCM